MATDTQVNHLVSMMRNELTTCNQRSVRSELRRNELHYRQNQLFKVFTEVLKKYEHMGFSIVFTGEHDLLFRSLNEVREITEKWLSEYNCERPHESLNNMTPEEYRQHHYLSGISKNAWN